MKKIVFFISIILSAFLQADECALLPSPENCLNCCSPLEKGTSISIMCFQPKIEGLDYCISNSSPSRELEGTVNAPDINWSCGGKLQLTYKSLVDVDVNGSFYIMDEIDRQRKDVVDQTDINENFNGLGLIPIWTHPRTFGGYLKNVRFTNARSKWDLGYYLLNVLVGKSFCISNNISLKPQFGLGNIFFYQKYKVIYNDGKTFPIAVGEVITPGKSISLNNQKTYGIGPKVGINSLWYFYKNTSFFANLYGTLLYTYFYSSRHDQNEFFQTGISDTYDAISSRKSLKTIKPFLEILLGISYEKCLSKTENIRSKKSFVRFSLAYETQVLWKMNQFIRFFDDVNDGLNFSPKGDFTNQSFNISLEFLF